MRNGCAPPRLSQTWDKPPPSFLEYSIVAPSVDSRTFSIKGQSSLDEQSKFYRINPPFRPSTRHAVRFVFPSTLSSLVLIRTTTGITSATPSVMAHRMYNASRMRVRDAITLSRISNNIECSRIELIPDWFLHTDLRNDFRSNFSLKDQRIKSFSHITRYLIRTYILYIYI